MTRKTGSLNGSGVQEIHVELTYLGYNQAGNYSSWSWAAIFDANGGGQWVNSGNTWQLTGFAATGPHAFAIPEAWAYTGEHTLGSGTFTKTHNASGYLSTGTMTLSVNTNHSDIGDGSVGVSSGTVPRIPKVPTAPGTPTASGITSSGLTLAWTAPSDNGGSGITSYTIQYATNASFTGASSTTSTTLNKVFSSLSASTQYWFRVRANNAVGNSAWSGTRTATTLTGIPDPVPSGDLDGWARIGTKPANIHYFTTEGIRRGTFQGKQALYLESVASGSFTMAANNFGMRRDVTGLTVGKSYRMTADAIVTGTSPLGDEYKLVIGSTSGSSTTLSPGVKTTMPPVEVVAAATTLSIGFFLTEGLSAGSDDEVERVALYNIKLWEINTDYPERLRSTVYESDLANHLDLACNSVGASWYVAKDGQTRFTLPGASLPVSYAFSDVPTDDALSYIDVTTGYDTKSTVNHLEVTNLGWDSVGDVEDNDELIAENAENMNRYGTYSEDLQTNLWMEAPYDDALVNRLTSLLDAYDEPDQLITGLRLNARQDLAMATGLEVGQRISVTFNGTTQDSLVVSINHEIGHSRWMLNLTLTPLT